MVKRFNTTKLRTPEILQQFKIELRNRYQVLQLLKGGNKKWNRIIDLYQDTAKEVIGYRKSNLKEWLSQDTWERIKERRLIKQRLLLTYDPSRKRVMEVEYQNKDREVKRSARKDKRST